MKMNNSFNTKTIKKKDEQRFTKTGTRDHESPRELECRST